MQVKTGWRAACAFAAVLAAGGEAGAVELLPPLQPLQPFLGRTWRGTLPGGTAEKPLVDVVRYEAALGGHAVRVRHSVNDGAYGGETLIAWDSAKQSLAFVYFTNGGFYTQGTMRAQGGVLVTHEMVQGAAGGVTEVKAEIRLDADGRLLVKAQYLRGGEWGEGRETRYDPAPEAVVRFKE